jgi:hypothetical protein
VLTVSVLQEAGVPVEAEKSLIPTFLPDETPKFLDYYNWLPTGKQVLQRRYEVSMLPHGLLGRLLCRLLSGAKAAYTWKSGVILSWHRGATMAMVQSLEDEVRCARCSAPLRA